MTDRMTGSFLLADLKPYRWMGQALDSVMAAHVLYPKVDSNPAGFSEYWLKKVLREELHFTGVVFSDDLSMKGAVGVGDVTQRAQAALQAGCDMLIQCNDFEASDQLLASLKFEDMAERAERVKRLSPKGDAPTWKELVKTALYKRSKDLVPAV